MFALEYWSHTIHNDKSYRVIRVHWDTVDSSYTLTENEVHSDGLERRITTLDITEEMEVISHIQRRFGTQWFTDQYLGRKTPIQRAHYLMGMELHSLAMVTSGLFIQYSL